MAPSSSVYEVVLQAPSSCDSKILPNWLSAQRMGSSETRANGDRTSVHVGLPAASNTARKVWFPASMKTAPLFQFTPMDGSPAPCAPLLVEPSAGVMVSSAGWFAYFGAPGGIFGEGGLVRAATVSVAVAWEAVGIGTSAAVSRTCHRPSTGSVMTMSEKPGPVTVPSGLPGPYSAPVGLSANMSMSVGALEVHS